MTTLDCLRAGRDQDPGQFGSDTEVQRRQLVDAGVEPGRVYADVALSGANAVNSRGR